ncbi:hypothetical protein FA592_14130 [Sulfurospirillum diekertiae]|uniref:Uncharacterized protein n=1 Tax=Sulfurospirillum diekertiae TaxID=1854492 RepID=A0A1Y0HIJ4_9BACT|nr:hypothetical protein [Sulfurospirillum diekertiae]ARU47909.1 hypothetical protein Sdiek1_0741 [Sulfurospirillum diekertiae]ASC92755.1 hypothetical protein Sdiek2_0732 [Sulfurospirillum diekertiae]QNA70451.1 hypothetical protein FA584_14020 [Sulfurospirillum diekertiae]QNT10499.1 hypothetical protein FA592_14130 [Sulfurospirillum diekertiae]
MTNLSVSEKLALEEVFECLKNENCRKISIMNKRLFAFRMMRLLILTRRKFLHVKR